MAKTSKGGIVSDAFVGRQREINIANRLMPEVRGGRGGALVVEGEPGIGKSRFVSEISKTAADSGMVVLLGRCHDGEAIPPYWPWIEILRRFDKTHLNLINDDPGIVAGVDRLLAELMGGTLPAQSTRVRASNSFLLQNEVIGLLKRTSKVLPLAIVLEDIHNADAASLSLLELITQSIETERIGIITTFRNARLNEDSRLSESIGVIAKARNYQRIHLSGIDCDQVRELMGATLGSGVSERAASAVFKHTEGNCLFVKELVRALIDEIGPIGNEPPDIEEVVRHHSRNLAPLIARRLGGLSTTSRHVLETAALLGREFSLAKLSAVVESVSADDLHVALRAARQLAFIDYLQAKTDHFSFVHSLYQDALVLRLGPGTAPRRRCAIGLALEAYYQEKADDHALEIASLLADAKTELEMERCYHYSWIAAEQAKARFAVDDRLPLIFKAYDLRRFRASDEELAEVYRATGAALTMMRQTKEATQVSAKAWEHLFTAGAVKKGLEIMAIDFFGSHINYEPGQLRVKLEQALAYAEPDSPDAAKIMSMVAVAEQFRGGSEEEVERWIDNSQEIAGNLKDPDTTFAILTNKAIVLQSRRKTGWDKFGATVSEMIGLAPAEFTETAYDAGLIRKGYLVEQALQISKLHDARSLAFRLLKKNRELGMPSAICSALRFVMISHRLEGNWDPALRYTEEALSQKKINHALCHARTLGDRAIIEYQLGNYRDGERYVKAIKDAANEIRKVYTLRSMRFCQKPPDRFYIEYIELCLDSTIALITGVDTGLVRYRELYAQEIEIQTIESAGASVGVLYYVDSYPIIGAATEAILGSDPELATDCYEVLKHDPSTMLYPHYWYSNIKGRLLGLLTLTMGDADTAAGYFEECYEFCRREGLKPMLTWICYDFARALFQRASGEDTKKAEGLLREGLSIAQALGMKPVMERITTLLAEQSKNGDNKKPKHPDNLTPREVEVLWHVAKGKTNQEIGRDLNISENTVSNHIKHAFTKTGTTNRVALASYAVRAGLAGSSTPHAPTQPDT